MNPVGASEGTIEDLLRGFEREESNNCRSRGLIANDKSELQTFEIFITNDIRDIYDRVECLLKQSFSGTD